MTATPSTDLLAKLYSSGAYLPLAIVLAFLGLTWASKHWAWLQAPNRVHYVSAGLTGLAVLVGPATQGTTPNFSMWLAAVGTIVALVLPGATPKGETPAPVTVDLSNKPPQAGFARLGVMIAIAAIGGALLFGCSTSTRQRELGYTLTGVITASAALDAYVPGHELALGKCDPATVAKADCEARVAKFQADLTKARTSIRGALDLIGSAYKLNNDVAVTTAEAAAAQAYGFLKTLGVSL